MFESNGNFSIFCGHIMNKNVLFLQKRFEGFSRRVSQKNLLLQQGYKYIVVVTLVTD